MTTVKLVDQHGRELPPAPPRRRVAASAPVGASGFGGGSAPYEAADIYGPHTAAWRPSLWSPDAELNIYRDRIVARVRDLVRNDGWAAGGITRILDNVIGGSYRPRSRPDYRALARHSGIKAFDSVWAREYSAELDAGFRVWSNDIGRWCDAGRNMMFRQLMYVGFRHLLIDGDALAVMQWLPERVAPGLARYATAVQLVDPDRLSNPQLVFDQQWMRGGVQVDALGAATGYWIREAHQGDWFAAAKSLHWDLVPRETTWGRPITILHYEHMRAGQHRGGAGVLTPVLARLKMLAKYDSVELDAAIVNAIFGAYIESPFDHSILQDALSEGGGAGIGAYQDERAEYHKDHRTVLGGVQIPLTFPGEKINTVAAARPASNFRDFERAVLNNAASALGISAQQMSQDWSDTNYSSARAALLEAWKTMKRRRDDYSAGFAHPIWTAWVEEAFETDALPLPMGAPDFIEGRHAYAQARWLGPGRGWIDPVAEKEGAILGIAGGLSSQQDEVEENVGRDLEEILDEQAEARLLYAERGVPYPDFGAMRPSVKTPGDGGGDTKKAPAA